MKIIPVPFLLLLLLLEGCVAASYSPQIWYSEGYSDNQIAADRWQVRFTGNENSTEERVVDFAHLRAAEVCDRNGYAYFNVLEAYTEVEEIEVEEEVTYTDDDGEEHSETQTSTSYVPSAGHIVVCTHEPAPKPTLSLAAEYVQSTIAGKYGL